MDRPGFSNSCRCQLCQTLGGINLTVDIEDSTKISRFSHPRQSRLQTLARDIESVLQPININWLILMAICSEWSGATYTENYLLVSVGSCKVQRRVITHVGCIHSYASTQQHVNDCLMSVLGRPVQQAEAMVVSEI